MPASLRGRWRFPPTSIRSMIAHCVRESPLECCGLLGGKGPRVLVHSPAAESGRQRNPVRGRSAETLEAGRWLAARAELEILAIYHSHPRWEAVPSAVDREKNYWGAMPHLIVGFAADPPEVRVWRLSADSHRNFPGRWPNRSARLPGRCNPGRIRTKLISRIARRDRNFRTEAQRSHETRRAVIPH